MLLANMDSFDGVEETIEQIAETVQKEPTPFNPMSWVYAILIILALLLIRRFLRNKAMKEMEINVFDELRKREGVYRIEDFKPDYEKGALQKAPKDEDDCIKLKLVKRTKVTHDTYYFR